MGRDKIGKVLVSLYITPVHPASNEPHNNTDLENDFIFCCWRNTEANPANTEVGEERNPTGLLFQIKEIPMVTVRHSVPLNAIANLTNLGLPTYSLEAASRLYLNSLARQIIA